MPSSRTLKSAGFSPLTYFPLLSVTVKLRTTRSTFDLKIGVTSWANSHKPAPDAAISAPMAVFRRTFVIELPRIVLVSRLLTGSLFFLPLPADSAPESRRRPNACFAAAPASLRGEKQKYVLPPFATIRVPEDSVVQGRRRFHRRYPPSRAGSIPSFPP